MDRLPFAQFFQKADAFRIARVGVVGWIAIAVVVGTLGLVTASVTLATARGDFLQPVQPAPRAAQHHVVRTHGWGGYYHLTGRGHFGGGSRVH